MMKAKAWCMIPHSTKDGIEIEMKPLVLCGECRYWRGNASKTTKWLPCCEVITPKEWFCADGEERGEDE